MLKLKRPIYYHEVTERYVYAFLAVFLTILLLGGAFLLVKLLAEEMCP